MDRNKLQKIIEDTNAMLNRKGLGPEFFMNIGIIQINIPGIKGYFTNQNVPQMNHVGLAQLDDTNADYVIQQTIELFSREKKSFTWIVGPSSRPKDLANRLVRFGFSLREDMSEYGMSMSTEDEIHRSQGSVEVKEVPLEDLEKSAHLIAESSGQGG